MPAKIIEAFLERRLLFVDFNAETLQRAPRLHITGRNRHERVGAARKNRLDERLFCLADYRHIEQHEMTPRIWIVRGGRRAGGDTQKTRTVGGGGGGEMRADLVEQ